MDTNYYKQVFNSEKPKVKISEEKYKVVMKYLNILMDKVPKYFIDIPLKEETDFIPSGVTFNIPVIHSNMFAYSRERFMLVSICKNTQDSREYPMAIYCSVEEDSYDIYAVSSYYKGRHCIIRNGLYISNESNITSILERYTI